MSRSESRTITQAHDKLVKRILCTDSRNDAACLLPLNQPDSLAVGDLAACAALCDCDADCDHALSCLALAVPIRGRAGYCGVPGAGQTSSSCGGGGSPG